LGKGEVHKGFWWGNLREIDHLEEPEIGGRMTLRWMDLQEVGCGGMDWIDMVQDRDSWWKLVDDVMNVRVQ
jgi:hypothetical protein